MYDAKDPRAGLAAPASTTAYAGPFFAAEYGRFYADPPQEADAQAQHWYTRGQNFVVVFTRAEAGAVMGRTDQVDEYVVLLPDPGSVIEIEAQDGSGGTAMTRVEGPAIVMVPPGPSTIMVVAGGQVVRLLTHHAADLVARCANAAAYATPHPAVTPVEPWPAPAGGWRVRAYDVDVPEMQGRFGRIWRCTTFMVNWFYPRLGPRDVTKLSPHHHDDFEQGSLALDGEFVHHLRWPWTTDLNAWREDEHALCGSPSIAVIPPPSIHTTQAIGAGHNTLVDIFSPPRLDFSRKPGWVLNADDYGMPDV